MRSAPCGGPGGLARDLLRCLVDWEEAKEVSILSLRGQALLLRALVLLRLAKSFSSALVFKTTAGLNIAVPDATL